MTRLLGGSLVKSLLVVATLTLFSAARPVWAVDLSGCWEGCWASNCTRHHGPLKATFVKCGDDQYDVHFRGRFFGVLPFKYSVTLDVVEDRGDSVTLSGSHYLGRMFGTFTYTAEATACQFHSRYDSCKDNGVFKLSKVAACSTCCD
ncbi:MAG TPA: hypothetical protein VL096_19050 [Pirellulaceae bacterium]|nr:hypothetical protein [Pirellulaceae bacterium]